MPALFHCRPRLAVLAGTVAMVPAMAPAQDLAPKALWSLLVQAAAETGGTLTARATRTEGDTVIFADVAATVDRDVTLTIPDLRLTRLPDGVEIAFPQPFRIAANDSPRQTFHLTVTADGSMALRLAGPRAGAWLDFARLAVAQTFDDRTDTPDTLSANLTLNGVRGSLDLGLAAPHDGDLSLTLTDVSYDLDFAQNPRPEVLRSNGSLAGLDLQATLRAFPGPQSRATMRQAFAAGFLAEGTLALTGLAARGDHSLRGRASQASGALGSLNLNFRMADGRLSLDAAAAQVAADVAAPEGRGGARLEGAAIAGSMPLLAAGAPADLSFSQSVTGFSVSRELLDMVGAGAFAGDAASISFDLNAQTLVTRDVDLDEMDDTPPFDLRRMVMTLSASLGAAVLTADADLTPAPGALERLDDGPPDVTGRINADLRGGQALIQRLTQAGILQGQQSFMAAGILGAVGRAVGEDHLVSEIELRPGGQVLVNGAPAPF